MDRLQSMRVFQRVIDEGGFAAAARALDMSPAVVTRLVADLEEHLGTRLVHRSTRKVSLSEAGEAYLARVRAILQDIDEADALANLHTQELAGELHVLATPVLATYLLAPMLAGFRAKYPKITLHIRVESFEEPSVEEHDVTLFAADEAYDGTIVARKIATTHGILVAAPSYMQRKGIPQTPDELIAHDCLELSGSIARHKRWHLRNETNPQETVDLNLTPVISSNHIETLIAATLDGVGITPCTVELVGPLLATGELVRVLAPWVAGQVHLYAALPSRQYLPRRTRVFLDYLTEQTALMLADAQAVCGGMSGLR